MNMHNLENIIEYRERQLLLDPTEENAHNLQVLYNLGSIVVERGGDVLSTDESALAEGVDESEPADNWERDVVIDPNSGFDPFELDEIVAGSITSEELSTDFTVRAEKNHVSMPLESDIIISEYEEEEEDYFDSLIHVPRYNRTQILTLPKAASLEIGGQQFALSGKLVIRVSNNGTRVLLENLR
jgi:hypothetical protein